MFPEQKWHQQLPLQLAQDWGFIMDFGTGGEGDQESCEKNSMVLEPGSDKTKSMLKNQLLTISEKK